MPDTFLSVPLTDRLLWFIVLLVAVFFGSALSLVSTVVGLRVRNVIRARRLQERRSRWDAVITGVLFGETPECEVHERVRSRDHGDFVDFLYPYSTLLKGTERMTVRRLAEPYLSTVAQHASRGKAEERARAIQVLGELGSGQYASRITSMLQDRSPLVAITAAQALARMGARGVTQRLVARLESVELWNTRFLASLLADLGPDSAPVLRDVLSDTTRPARTRALAAHTLEQLNDLSAAAVAADVLETEVASAPDASEAQVDLLVAALRVIRKVGRDEHLPPIRKLLNSSHQAVRGYAVHALAALGGPADVLHVERAIDDESSWVVMHAARGLVALGRIDILDALVASEHPHAMAASEVLAGVVG